MRVARLVLVLSACASSAAPSKEHVSRPTLAAETSVLGQGVGQAAAQDAALAVDAAAHQVEPVVPRPSALPSGSASTSIGSPSNGRLVGGVPLPLEGPGFRFNSRRDSGARFGTVEVIGAIERAASSVRAHRADSELIVNDVSLSEGGRIAHHGSHRAGRDADILFYLRGDDGQPTPSVGAPLDREGIGFDFKDLSEPEDDVRVRFDAERTWLLVAALLEDPEAVVQRIFVVEHLRSALLAAAQRAGAKPETIARFSDVTCQPSYPHDDHLHVRWFCSVEDLALGCEDLAPLYPWREAELKAQGVTPVLAARSRSVDPAPITTNADAEREVKRQRPHKDVFAFLARRKSWEKQPHPGRPYCP